MSRLNEILANTLLIELALRKLNPAELLNLYHSIVSGGEPPETVKTLLAEAKASADKELELFRDEIISSLRDGIKEEILEEIADSIKDDVQSDIIFEIRERLS